MTVFLSASSASFWLICWRYFARQALMFGLWISFDLLLAHLLNLYPSWVFMILRRLVILPWKFKSSRALTKFFSLLVLLCVLSKTSSLYCLQHVNRSYQNQCLAPWFFFRRCYFALGTQTSSHSSGFGFVPFTLYFCNYVFIYIGWQSDSFRSFHRRKISQLVVQFSGYGYVNIWSALYSCQCKTSQKFSTAFFTLTHKLNKYEKQSQRW